MPGTSLSVAQLLITEPRTTTEAPEALCVVMASVAAYDNGDGPSDDDIRGFDSRANQAANVANWADNQEATSQFIEDEFAGSGTGRTGNEDSDDVANRMLQDMLLTGQADEADMMAFGIEDAGTREDMVTKALEQIAGAPDAATRLKKLDDLGAYCGSYLREHVPEPQPFLARVAALLRRCARRGFAGREKTAAPRGRPGPPRPRRSAARARPRASSAPRMAGHPHLPRMTSSRKNVMSVHTITWELAFSSLMISSNLRLKTMISPNLSSFCLISSLQLGKHNLQESWILGSFPE